jgi:hypothetical protein
VSAALDGHAGSIGGHPAAGVVEINVDIRAFGVDRH